MVTLSKRSVGRIIRYAVVGMTFTALVIVLLSCGTGTPRTPNWQSAGGNLVWPQPPEKARIRFEGILRDEQDLGRDKNLGEKIADVLLGKKPSEMVKPVALARNEAGLLAVVDPATPTVHLFDLTTRKYKRLTQKTASVLQSPVGVAIDREGKLYVSDSVRQRVFVFDSTLKLVATWGEGILDRPTGLALSAKQDRLYVVDTVACRVVALNLSGEKLLDFGGKGVEKGQFNYPTYIATTSADDICVADSLNFRIQVFDPQGKVKQCFGLPGDGAGDFARPKGLGVDSGGRIYVVDAAFENVQIFDPEGRLLLAFGSPGNGSGQFTLPCGLCIDSSDRIWVADSFNRRIEVFRLLENVE